MIVVATMQNLSSIVKLVKPLYVNGLNNYWCDKNWLVKQIKAQKTYISISKGKTQGVLIYESNYITVLSVFKKYQRQGIASKLIQNIKGLSCVDTLKIYGVVPFYERLGFKQKYSYTVGKYSCIHLSRGKGE